MELAKYQQEIAKHLMKNRGIDLSETLLDSDDERVKSMINGAAKKTPYEWKLKKDLTSNSKSRMCV